MTKNPSIAPPSATYVPSSNPFGHGLYLSRNVRRCFAFARVIDFFDATPDGDFLSNFYPCEIRLDQSMLARLIYQPLWAGLEAAQRRELEAVNYPTTEHAFAAMKAVDVHDYMQVALAPDADTAKALGRNVQLRPDWRRAKVSTMEALLAVKFAPGSDLAARLLATETKMLIEGTTWGDDVWGVAETDGCFVGENLLGVLLVERRGALRQHMRGEAHG